MKSWSNWIVGEGALKGARVMITRPAPQSARLCRLVERAGGYALCFPVIEISAVQGEGVGRARALLDGSSGYDAMIFISRNAVFFCDQICPGLFARDSLPAVYAAGAGTRQALSVHGIVAASGTGVSGTEGLLRLRSLDARYVSGRRLLIVRGVGGRERLKEELERRGAQVHYAEVYRRAMPQVDADTLRKLWQDQKPDAIVITSVQSLDNLLALTGSSFRQTLLNTPLAVISARVGDHAMELGFKHRPSVADSASDAALAAAVAQAIT